MKLFTTLFLLSSSALFSGVASAQWGAPVYHNHDHYGHSHYNSYNAYNNCNPPTYVRPNCYPTTPVVRYNYPTYPRVVTTPCYPTSNCYGYGYRPIQTPSRFAPTPAPTREWLEDQYRAPSNYYAPRYGW